MPTWPATLNHLIERGSFRYKPSEPQLRSGFERGPARMRRRFTRQIATVDGTLVMDSEEFLLFRSFWQNELDFGVQWFTMPVWDGNSYVTETVRAKEPFDASDHEGIMTAVGLSLEIRNQRVISLGLGQLLGLYGFAALMRMSDIVDRHVNVQWGDTEAEEDSLHELALEYRSPSGAIPSLVLDFQNARLWRRTDPDADLEFLSAENLLEFSRSSVATVWNSNGQIEFVSADAPRLNHDGAGNPLGLIIEEARTNLCLWSQDWTQASWNGAASFNISSAESVVQGGVAGRHVNLGASSSRTRTQFIGTLSGSAETFTCVIENVSAVTSSFGIRDTTLSSWVAFVTYNWATGALSGTVGTVSAEILAEAGPNGGKLVRIVVTGIGTVGNSRTVNVYPTGTPVNTDEAILHYAQLEIGAFATSYIPTEGATASRSAEFCGVSLADFSFSQSEGSAVVHANTHLPDSVHRMLSLDDGTSDGRLEIRFAQLSTAQVVVSDGGVVASPSVGNSALPGETVRVATAWEQDRVAISANGGALITDNSATIPTVDTLRIGGFFGLQPMNGHVARLVYYPESLSDADLVSLAA